MLKSSLSSNVGRRVGKDTIPHLMKASRGKLLWGERERGRAQLYTTLHTLGVALDHSHW